ncbi:hypothetical protein C9975_02985 [Thalassospira xiamenensis]|nr:hypothetical protein C9975_02985 [Thalassospira xiamenensis]
MNSAQQQQQPIDFNLKKLVDAATIFPDVFQKGEKKIQVRVNRSPDCIASNPNYVPDEQVLRMALAWWNAPIQPQVLGLHGETGTGKTELLLYIADLLNEPVYMAKCHPALMPEDLEGTRILQDGKTPFIPGPAARAYQQGGLLILDEIDKLNLASQAAIHGLVEGKPWPIEQIGKTISKHPNTRIAATGNTTGEGGSESYISSQRMDDALRSRIGWIRTNYPEPRTELKILKKAFPQLPTELSFLMVKVANALRDARLGKDRKGVDDPIGCVCSTRTIVNWAFYTMVYEKKSPWSLALNFAMSGSIDPESQEAVDAIIQRLLEDDDLELTIDSPVEKFIEAVTSKK